MSNFPGISMYKNTQQGQALLIVVLVMVVSLTIGLSVASRSITNLRITAEEEDSQRAFSAAEAGVERALKSGADGVVTTELPVPLYKDAQIKEVSISGGPSSSLLLNRGSLVNKDDGADIWLVDHKDDGTIDFTNPPSWTGNITVYWNSTATGCVSSGNPAAMEIIAFSGTQSNPVVKRYAIDTDSVFGRRANNKFDLVEGGGVVLSRTFTYSKTIPIANGIFVRVIPLYNSTCIGVVGTINLPSQGIEVTSTGKAGDTERKINFYRGFPKLPSEFFYILLRTNT